MNTVAIYQSKLTTAEIAVSPIRSGSIISIGMAMCEPPALLRALAEPFHSRPRPASRFRFTVTLTRKTSSLSQLIT
jgi:acyl-CoA hydrolase